MTEAQRLLHALTQVASMQRRIVELESENNALRDELKHVRDMHARALELITKTFDVQLREGYDPTKDPRAARAPR